MTVEPRGAVLLALLRASDLLSQNRARVIVRRALAKHRYIEATAVYLRISSRTLQRLLAELPELRPTNAPTRGRPAKPQPTNPTPARKKSQP